MTTLNLTCVETTIEAQRSSDDVGPDNGLNFTVRDKNEVPADISSATFTMWVTANKTTIPDSPIITVGSGGNGIVLTDPINGKARADIPAAMKASMALGWYYYLVVMHQTNDVDTPIMRGDYHLVA